MICIIISAAEALSPHLPHTKPPITIDSRKLGVEKVRIPANIERVTQKKKELTGWGKGLVGWGLGLVGCIQEDGEIMTGNRLAGSG